MRFTCRLQCLHHPHSNESHKASSTSRCVQFAFYQRGSKVKAVSAFAYQELRTGRRGLSCTTPNKQGWVFFYLALAAPPTPALKGLTSLCGSRSLSCTDLINNFYQPLAQEISRGWAGGGRGWVCVQAGRGGVGGWRLKTPGGRERAFDHVSATRDRGIHHD